MKTTDLAYHITTYLGNYLPGQQGVSQNTVKSYRDTFSLLLTYCDQVLSLSPDRVCLKQLNKNTIEGFVEWLEIERHCKIATRNQRLACIHAFFRYLQIEAPEHMLQCQQILSIRYKRTPKASFNYVSTDGMKAIFSQPSPDSLHGYRDLVLLSVLYDTGARVQELADLTVGDIRTEEPPTIRLTGKGNKARIVPLMSQTAQMLRKYIQLNCLDSIEKKNYPLFVNRQRKKLTRAGISYILDKYTRLAHEAYPDSVPEKLTPHCFRHSKAMHLLQAGVNLVYIRDLLGHVDIKTTEIYARADSKMMRKALESANSIQQPADRTPWQNDKGLMAWLGNLCKPV